MNPVQTLGPMSLWQTYSTPKTLREALEDLRDSPQPAAVLAGGTDLLLELQQGLRPPVGGLIDISRVEEMRRFEVGEGEIFIGAAVRLHELIESAELFKHAPGLVEACRLIGGPQVRNVATLGGNVGHALPAGDGTIALLSHSARALLASLEGERWLPLDELFEGPGKVTFNRSKELLVGFSIGCAQEGQSSAFRRIMRPQGVAIAILNMGIWLALAEGGKIRSARIAVGPAAPVPFRAAQTEAFLQGKTVDQATGDAAFEVLLSEVHLRTSRHRATQDYRRHVLRVLMEETVSAAHKRAALTMV